MRGNHPLTSANGVNTTTSRSHFLVLPHAVHKQCHRLGLEVDVSVQCQQVCVLGLGSEIPNRTDVFSGFCWKH